MSRLGADLFLLDPGVVHLNHGSFGAVPVPVLEAQRAASHAIERSPERFYRSGLFTAMEEVRSEVAAFLACDVDGVALVENATQAVQIVLQAVDARPGRQVVITDHTYPWVRAAVARLARTAGVSVHEVHLPCVEGGEVDVGRFAASLREACSDDTALVILDQITSASATLLPVDAAIAAVPPDVPVLVDGAHAPGSIDRPVPVGSAFWLGNLHKWAFAARTAAALVVAPAWRSRVAPLVESAGSAEGFPRSFTYLGTQDPSALMALPASLAFPTEHLGMSFADLRARNRAVLAEGLDTVAQAVDLTLGPDPGMPMRTFSWGRAGDDADAARWTRRLREEEGVEVAITSVRGMLHARVSVQCYVAAEDVAALGTALSSIE